VWPICRNPAAVQRQDIDSALQFGALRPRSTTGSIEPLVALVFLITAISESLGDPAQLEIANIERRAFGRAGIGVGS
jgi:hypothetical protein